MAPIRKPNCRVQVINNIRAMVGLELLQAAGQFVEGNVANGSNSSGPNMEDVDVDDFIGIERVESPNPTQHYGNVQLDISRRTLKDLSYELVAPKFGIPMQQAVKELKVSKSILQVWCRIKNIPRWPNRKIQSMEILLTNVQEFGMDEFCKEKGVVFTLQQLQEEKRAIEENPSLAIKDSTLALRKYMHTKSFKKRSVVVNKEKN